MVLTRGTVTAGLLEELHDFGALVRSLKPEEWRTPSRCEGWTVADVAAHVAGQLADVVSGKLEGLGTPEVTQREVEERRGRSPIEIADEMETGAKIADDLLAGFDDDSWNGPAPGSVSGTLGEGVEALWADAYVHADDIRSAIKRPSPRGAGLEAAVSHLAAVLAQRGWGPATLSGEGDEVRVRRDGRTITVDAFEFVLAATGRRDPGPLGLDSNVNVYA